MNCLLKMRAQRDQMSVNERKLADFILDNIELLRDYSSQQLADAVGVSQSSVVKFSQKLGYRGYPSLKLAVYESYAGSMMAQAGDDSARHFSGGDSPLSQLGQKKFEILENTTSINEADQITAAIAAIRAARCIQVSACPGSVAVARYLTHQLLECGRWAIFDEGGKLQSPIARTLEDDDLLFIVCDLGGEESLVDVVNRAREQGARVLSITRYNYNAASIHSDIRLYVAPAEGDEGWQRILFRAAQMHLIEGLIGGLINQEG
ncbi:MurR/RpiR family transcriptional regulator [Microbulbifer thermotolerans]|uniref:Transcriptional regulator n=1 Tax=Microbulbifer thermotolerans TaxID=252514 RepID=A0A143HNB3_MICTH|nr:MurR/RpiR family transcriptional regulator [Microbulbifer thermotolerans]AMX02920.1 transcriptional regulator [Microbulbifer thermotolerans]MCX2779830.1 MurR/RpiR family transcriptional regulator [Microbulbifer thermotolerans]MCX2781649.1 MurR/RpiR family transcriptional regulator [Microbulbifer thermotolerans]MCX2794808.1 MurR/RpiR family transcriptional regulator [Microbulbifer thermotolerans]MCX2802284.1 MurR/RpiR family transcriptional regulator [Microbulbifer thermotolerans]